MTKLQTYIDRNKEIVEVGSQLLKRVRQAETMVNSLANMLLDAASKGYVSSNDLDFANDCLDKLKSPRHCMHWTLRQSACVQPMAFGLAVLFTARERRAGETRRWAADRRRNHVSRIAEQVDKKYS